MAHRAREAAGSPQRRLLSVALALVLAGAAVAQDRNATPDRNTTPDRTMHRGERREGRDGGHTPPRDEPVPPPAEERPGPAPVHTPVGPPPVSDTPSGGGDRPEGPFVTPWRDSGPVIAPGPVIREGTFIQEWTESGPVIAPTVPERPECRRSDGSILGPPPKKMVRIRTATGWEYVSQDPVPQDQPPVAECPEDYKRPALPPREYEPEPETPARRSRRAAGKLARARLKRVSPGEASFLEKLDGTEVIVVPGRMDSVEEVLDNASIPYRTVFAETFKTAALDPVKNIVMINCPGEGFDASGMKRLVAFVNAGGWVMTTDWTIANVIEKGFPGIIKAAPKDTDEECVPVRMQDTSHPFLNGVFDPTRMPQWALDLDSFPIEIVKPKAVRVLISSPAMKAKYDHDPVGVVFEKNKGQVFHLTSHFCLQRAPADGPLAKIPAEKYLDDEISGRDVKADAADEVRGELSGVTAAELEAHYTATKMIANVIVEHVRRARAMSATK